MSGLAASATARQLPLRRTSAASILALFLLELPIYTFLAYQTVSLLYFQ